MLARLGPAPPLRFIAPAEKAITRRMVDQRDGPRIPVVEMIDARLAEAQTDGWRYADEATVPAHG